MTAVLVISGVLAPIRGMATTPEESAFFRTYSANGDSLPSANSAGRGKDSIYISRSPENAVGGKMSGDISDHVTDIDKGDGGVPYIEYLWGEAEQNCIDEADAVAKWTKSSFVGYLVTEVNVLNNGKFGDFSIRTRGNKPVSNAVSVAALKEGWNKLAVVIENKAAEDGSIVRTAREYVNGEEIIPEKDETVMLGKFESLDKYCMNELRLVFKGVKANGSDLDIYIDDINIYETDSEPILDKPIIPDNGVGMICDSGTGKIYVTDFSGKTAGDIGALISDVCRARVYADENMTKQINGSEALSAGQRLVIEGAHKTYTTYTVAQMTQNEIIVSGKNCNSADKTIQGPVNIEAYAPGGGVLIAAQYNKESLLGLQIVKEADATGKLSMNYARGAENGVRVEIMLFDSLENLKPLCNKEIYVHKSEFDDNIDLGASSVFGDYTYFNSDECKIINSTRTAIYEGFEKGPKNQVQTNRLINYQSPNRQDHIYMNNFDEPGEDCYFDINMPKPGFSQWTPKKYSYYLIEGNFMKENFGSRDTLFWLRDSSGTTQQNFYPFLITGEGQARTSDGRTLSVNIRKGKWFNYKLAVDLIKFTADIYINDELVAEGIACDKNFTEITKVRCIINKNTGKSDMYIKNFRVSGLAKPYRQISTYRTGVFTDEVKEREYLNDKVAMHAYGKQIFANGEKSLMSPEPVYDKSKDELYVSAETIEKAFNLPNGSISASASGITYKRITFNAKNGVKTGSGGETLIPAKEFCETALNKHVFSMDNGLIIFYDRQLMINKDGWKYYSLREPANRGVYNGIDFLNSFMTYERPDREQILADFKKKSGGTGSHPRVMANKEDFDALRKLYQSDNRYKAYADKYIEQADAYLKEDVCVYRFDDAMRALTVARRVVARMRAWGYAYQITGDKKYVDRAWLEFQAAATFPDYNTCHIIDTGEFVHAFGIGYDWMYEGFTQKQRDFILNTFYNKAFMSLAVGLYGGITAGSGGSNRYVAFMGPTNYNAVINGGVVTAALAFMEMDPEFCAQAISDSLKSVENTFQLLMPGGAWIESISYWEYAMQYIDVLMGACDSALGSTYGLERSQGFNETLNYAIACFGLEGTIGYHDGATTQDYSYDCQSYLAKKLNNRGAAAMRAYDLAERGAKADIYTMLYYDAGIYEDYKNILNNMDKTMTVGCIEMYTVRSTYDTNAEDGLYFGTHFGPRECYHSQNDEGTFVLDMMGERWAEELGSDNYNLQNEKRYKASQLYRYRTEGQNTFTFNNGSGYNQTGGDFYPIGRSEGNEYSSYVVTDLSGLYEDVPNMKLGYYIGDNLQTVTMRAEMTANKEAESYWFMHTKAEILIENGMAYLTKNGKTVRLELEMEGGTAEFIEMEAKPLPNSPVVPEQNPNKEYRKVAVKFNLKKDVPSSLVVKISPAHIPQVTKVGKLDEWSLRDENNM